MRQLGATVTVDWGYDVEVTITLTPRNWARVKAGKPVGIRGKGYYYEGEFFRDYWNFDGGLEGSLVVTYTGGGEGYSGPLSGATIEERPLSMSKRKR